MHKLLETSLASRIISILCSYTILFWLLSEAGALYYNYHTTDNAILDSFAHQLDFQTRIENENYLYTLQDARYLLKSWEDTYTTTMFHSTPTQPHSTRAHFFPFPNSKPNKDDVKRALSVVEAFGSSHAHEYRDTFILLPGQGVAFYFPSAASKQQLAAHLKELQELERAPSYNKTRWGRPIYDPQQASWYVSVAAVHSQSGIMAGFNVGLNTLNIVDRSGHKPATLLWLNLDNRLLPFPSKDSFSIQTINALLPQLPSCNHLVTAKLDAYRAVCKPLKDTPWKVLLLYPRTDVMAEVLNASSHRIPFALIALVFLIATSFVVLRNLLARPLSHFIEIIDHVSPSDLGHRLPEDRKDELGRIARAYNSLLTTIAAHYATLERKVQERTQEMDEARRHAEQASQRKSDHITNISHEIRTPLNGIVGALSMLQQNPLSQDQQDLVYTALQSSSHLLGIINNLLDFSRIEAGQMELSIEKTELFPLLDQAILTVNIKAKEKRLELYALVMADVPRYVMLDELRVRQILVNLLGNAIKFTEKGHVKLVVKVRDHQLAFTVEDTGKGVPPEQQSQIFLPFSQVRAHENGSGLGLTIASRLANLMGGEIQLESHLNWGSHFTLLLPLDESIGTEPSPFIGKSLTAPAPLHPQLKVWGILPEPGPNPELTSPELWYLPGRLWNKLTALLSTGTSSEHSHALTLSPWSLKILLVDDVPTNRDIIGKMLRQQGHQVELAAGGLAALALGQKHVFDLVLMDVRMPDLDGLETTRQWRNPKHTILDPDCPIIALTANALPAERDRVIKAGMNDYLAKPVTMQQLASAVELAGKLQLARGIEPTPNAILQTPLLNVSEESIRQQLLSTLSQLHAALQTAYHANDCESFLDSLHALKGAAGQGGLTRVHNASEELENKVSHGYWPSPQDIKDLASLIQQSSEYTT